MKPTCGEFFMYGKFVSITLCLIAMMISACIPMSEYTALETELDESRIQKTEAEQKLNNLEIELRQAESRLQSLNLELRDEEIAGEKCSRKLEDLKIQGDYLKNINLQQAENIKTLEQELNKKKSVIRLQEKVIQLFDDTKKTIETSLKDQIADQEIEVVEVDDKLKVSFIDKILFDSGSVEINPGGKELLLTVAESFKGNSNKDIRVEGHTDNVPLTAALKKRFPSNWELSTARAAAVVRFLQQEGGIQPERLSACGHSFYKSIATNSSERGRRQNRRIEIILAPHKQE
jgi:chemotaxis protein MotB